MARARLLKPGFYANEDLAEIDFAGRLLFAGLWTLADREGRLLDRPKRIKAALFPYDNVELDDLLHELAGLHFIVRYEVNGERYIQVVNFLKHQTPHVREPASTLPAQGATEAYMRLALDEPESGPAVAVPVAETVAEAETETETVAVAVTARVAPPEPDLEGASPWLEIRSSFENTLGLIGGDLVEEAKGYARTVPVAWFLSALSETREHADRPSWKYVRSILDRCLSEQRPPGPRKKAEPEADVSTARGQMLQRARLARGA